jgi:lipopolysaccharide/colanic/teichoic acid biosynthesis glycosyltransferase
VALDIRYARERSFAGDLRILARTVPAVLARRGAI